MKIKFDKTAFEHFYNEQTLEEKRRIRDRFLSEAGLSYPSFYAKRARGNFSPLEIEKLAEITGINFSIK